MGKIWRRSQGGLSIFEKEIQDARDTAIFEIQLAIAMGYWLVPAKGTLLMKDANGGFLNFVRSLDFVRSSVANFEGSHFEGSHFEGSHFEGSPDLTGGCLQRQNLGRTELLVCQGYTVQVPRSADEAIEMTENYLKLRQDPKKVLKKSQKRLKRC